MVKIEEPGVSCLTRYIAYVTAVKGANGKIANALQIILVLIFTLIYQITHLYFLNSNINIL